MQTTNINFIGKNGKTKQISDLKKTFEDATKSIDFVESDNFYIKRDRRINKLN